MFTIKQCQYKHRTRRDKTKTLDIHQVNDFMMTVRCSQVQRRVIASIRRVYAGTSLHKHLDDFQMPLFSGPVQWTKSMIVPGKMLGEGWKRRLTKTFRPPYRVDRYNLTHPWFMSCSVSSSQTRTCMATPSRHHWNISSIAYINETTGHADENHTTKLA